MRRCLLPLLLAVYLPLLLLPAGPGNLRAATTPTAEAPAHSPDEVFAQMRKTFLAGKARGLHLRYQFHFGDPQGGNWWVTIDDGACKMGQGEIPGADVTFVCSGADWVQLSNGTLSGFRAYLTGRLRVRGSQALARKLDELFP